jgi:MerR family transcriptional regulator, redox-sensitive transcriptional activator SoxR
MRADDLLAIGEVARRSGLAPSAIRYYEQVGLITSTRTAGDRRRYQRSVLRRLAVIRSAQNVGLTLQEISAALSTIPRDAAPTKKQWHRISSMWRPALDRRIEALQALRTNLDSCIGCGCLSMRQCLLFNPDDELGRHGTGPRRKVAILDPEYEQ